ncbi:bifunctional DNA primase/polymerase [Actinophytocola sp.]|uniref:bifunctional DNA primase/polymerase n=1 Tax=Actinophytocola sp. TaxID=1872138 RepID=UPI003C77A4C0
MSTPQKFDAHGFAHAHVARQRPRAHRLHQLRDAALEAASLGYFVIPLWPESKVPAMHRETRCPGRGDCAHGHRGWEARATRDLETICRWWDAAPLNVGIAAGRSGLHVLDLDAAHGEQAPAQWHGCRDGTDVLARVAARAGARPPTDTRTVRTPTGGSHLYFQAPPSISLRNTVARVGWRVDSRGDGGFVVAAGSWREEGWYELAVDAPVRPMPLWLIPRLRPPAFPPASTSIVHGARPSLSRRRAYLTTVEARVTAAEPGTRHDVLLRSAYSLGRLVGGGDLAEDEARNSLLGATSRWPGSPSRKDIRTIDDGLTAGIRHPRKLAS